MLPSSPEGIASFELALFNACALLRPPEKLTVDQWADKYGMLSSEGSARPGRWSTATAEYQREPMSMLTPGTPFETVVCMWSSQVGKTAIGLWFAAFHIEHDPAPIMFVEPDETLAKTIAKDRIDPMIRDTPVLAPLFGKTRGTGNDTLRKSFPGGQITFAWASSPTQMASRPIRILITDEEGAYDAAPNKEGNPVTLARARMATFKGTRKHLRVSSPRLRKTCLMTKAFEASDQRHFYVACPQCGHSQTLRWEQLHWPTIDGKADTGACYYVCEQNGCEIVEADKYRMIRNGEWIAHNPGGGDGRTAGYHLSALYSTIGYTWSELIDEFLACEGLPDRLQAFTNTKLGLPWDEQAEGADVGELAKHVEDYPAEAPAWMLMVTCGADVQKDRIEATKWGWGERSQSGVIEHRIFHGATSDSKSGAWPEFDAWRRRQVEHESGLTLPTVCTFVDSSDGNRTQQVYEYCRSREADKVFACKGSSMPAAPLVAEAKRRGKTRTLLVMVGTSTAKDTLFARLQIADPAAAGYIRFPRHLASGCTKEYFAQLTAEALVTHQTKGGEISRWEKQRNRNEALDCAVYAFAAKEYVRPPMGLLAEKLRAKVARMTAQGLLPRPSTWAEKVGATAVALQQSLSSASSAALPSPQPAKSFRKQRKPIQIPGFKWIHG